MNLKLKKDIMLYSVSVSLIVLILGVILVSNLPIDIAIHWDINGTPNKWMNRYMFVVGFPVFMLLISVFLTTIIFSSAKEKSISKLATIICWVLPITISILYFSMLYMNLFNNLDIRILTCMLLGIMLILIGNYLLKIPMSQSVNFSSKFTQNDRTYRKTKLVLSLTFVSIGFSLLLSLFLYPLVSLVVIGLGILLFLIILLYSNYVAIKN